MAEPRENWSSRTGFIVAAVGSAVGLGNIWRFPYVAYDNGGGAFMVPYLIALLTAGIPLLFLDYIIGHKYRAAAPRAYKKMVKSAQFVGWWQTLVSFVIAIYYAAVIVWAGSYMVFSFGQRWGEDTTTFFVSDFVQHTGDLTSVFVPQMFTGLIIVWALAILIMFGGIRKGVELANKICIPLLIVLFGIMVFKAVNLPGAEVGLNAFFEPNWERMKDPNVWLAAYGHVFFSLSVGFGIMVTYASYLKRNTNLTGAGLVVGFANSSFELIAGIGIFAAIGFMAMSTGQEVSEVASGGVGLAFFVFPKIISTMGASGDFIGFLFFGSLVVAGISSLVSILEVPISAFQDKFAWSRKKAVAAIGGVCAVISIAAFSTGSSLVLVDVIDHFANNIGIVAGGLMSIVWVTWFNRHKIPGLLDHINRISSVKLGGAWVFMLTVITPTVLTIALGLKLINLVQEPYEGYSTTILLLFGWGVVVFFGLGAFILSRIRGRHDEEDDKTRLIDDAH
ncbi:MULTISPECIES: sodium-dependent transporter [unclassified Psychrobacter]|uniref:sodium-dependent transporter n=1 Tax=unclassified Psychrobacter TaxID=196806 RepID=UPI00071E7762|nr:MULTISPECIES: sodium-dependent transporter [unclassified Psychrobacter]OLF39414.1 sodium-dependent transporter [Psychrobacter sp. Cmf 22.2]